MHIRTPTILSSCLISTPNIYKFTGGIVNHYANLAFRCSFNATDTTVSSESFPTSVILKTTPLILPSASVYTPHIVPGMGLVNQYTKLVS